MPAHRKPTHRPPLLAAALVALIIGSGVALAAQVDQQPVQSAPEVTVADPPSPPSSSSTPPAPAEEELERATRPSRAADKPREKPEPRTKPTKASTPTRDASPTPETSTPTPTVDPEPTVTARTTSPAPRARKPSVTSGILGGTNAARADAGLPALAVSACLADMAQRHAERLAAEQGLRHQALGPVMSSCGVSAAGENVAMNHTGGTDMVGQWLDSPGHRANLLSSRFSLIGVGLARAADGAWYGVQVFGDK